MTNTQENGGRNWFAVIAILLIIGFFAIATLCAIVVHFYEGGLILVSIGVMIPVLVAAYYWVKAVIGFIEYVHKNSNE